MKADWLYDHCLAQMKLTELRNYHWLFDDVDGKSQEVNTPAFGADRVNHYENDDKTTTNSWLLSKGNRIVRFRTSWQLTEEQMATVGEKLLEH